MVYQLSFDFSNLASLLFNLFKKKKRSIYNDTEWRKKKDNIEIKKLYKQDIEDIIPLRIALQKVDFKNNLGIDEDILISRTREFLKENLNKDLFMYGGVCKQKN